MLRGQFDRMFTLRKAKQEREAQQVPATVPYSEEVRTDIMDQRANALLTGVGSNIGIRMSRVPSSSRPC